MHIKKKENIIIFHIIFPNLSVRIHKVHAALRFIHFSEGQNSPQKKLRISGIGLKKRWCRLKFFFPVIFNLLLFNFIFQFCLFYNQIRYFDFNQFNHYQKN